MEDNYQYKYIITVYLYIAMVGFDRALFVDMNIVLLSVT